MAFGVVTTISSLFLFPLTFILCPGVSSIFIESCGASLVSLTITSVEAWFEIVRV
jgi:hypothetical protein